jgi:hypothetical protein
MACRRAKSGAEESGGSKEGVHLECCVYVCGSDGKLRYERDELRELKV